MEMPTRKGPAWTLAASVVVFTEAFIDAFIDTEADQIEALKCLPIALLGIIVSVWWLSRRAEALARWKEQREHEWWMTDLPEEQ
jgi:hypothetical protein